MWCRLEWSSDRGRHRSSGVRPPLGGCQTGRLAWDDYSSKQQTGKVLVTEGGTGVTVTILTAGDTGHSGNGSVTSTTTGGQSKVMRFYDLNDETNTFQTVTITFSEAVQNVSFSLLDVDSASSKGVAEYQDVVTVLSPASWAATVHSNVG